MLEDLVDESVDVVQGPGFAVRREGLGVVGVADTVQGHALGDEQDVRRDPRLDRRVDHLGERLDLGDDRQDAPHLALGEVGVDRRRVEQPGDVDVLTEVVDVRRGHAGLAADESAVSVRVDLHHREELPHDPGALLDGGADQGAFTGAEQVVGGLADHFVAAAVRADECFHDLLGAFVEVDPVFGVAVVRLPPSVVFVPAADRELAQGRDAGLQVQQVAQLGDGQRRLVALLLPDPVLLRRVAAAAAHLAVLVTDGAERGR